MRFSSRLILACVALVCVTAAGVGFLMYQNLERTLVPAALEKIETEAEILAQRFGAEVGDAVKDLQTLRGATAVGDLVRALEDGQGETGALPARPRRELAALFSALLQAHPHYLQVRLIGVADDGREIVRADRRVPSGDVRVTPDSRLQQKGQRSYFAGVLATPDGGVYLTPIELNRERGRIEIPHVPVIRVAMPIYGNAEKAAVFLIINFDMRAVFASLRSSVGSPGSFYVVNRNGDYLDHPDPALRFGFDLGRRHRIQDTFPTLAENLGEGDAEAFRTVDAAGEGYALAMAPVATTLGTPAVIVIALPGREFLAPVDAVRRSSLFAGVAACLGAIVVAFWVAQSASRPVRQMASAVAAVDRNESFSLPDFGRSDLAVLAHSIERFVEQENLYRAMFESANDAVITQTLDGRVTSWNPAAERLYGYSAEEMIGKPLETVIPEDRRADAKAFIHLIERGDQVRRQRGVALPRDGRHVDVYVTISPIHDRAGKPAGVSLIVRDVTEEVRMQELIRLTVDASPAGMIVVDVNGQIDLANAAADRMFGYEPGGMIGMDIETLVPPALHEQHIQDRLAFQKSPESRAMGIGRDLHGWRADGREFPVEIGLNPVAAGGTERILAVVVDITERRRAEAEIRERTEELERSNAELAQFAYVASHDLQEPLRMVASFCDLLQRTHADKLDEDGREYIEFAVDGARRMQQLINDLLAFSRLNTRPVEPVPASADRAVQQALRNLTHAIEESGGRVDYADLPDVMCDPTQLRQLFQNLLSNSLKFHGEAPPRVKIDAERDGGFWRFSVSDNGIGVDPGQLESIFGIFQRLHTRDEYPGTGIGLAVCKRIVERQGGEIRAERGETSGTIFRFTLPVAEGVANDA